jgi:C4-dicarboxylate-specific signal transduction histidine kinase
MGVFVVQASLLGLGWRRIDQPFNRRKTTSLLLFASLFLAHLALAATSLRLGRHVALYQFFFGLIIAPLFFFDWNERKLRNISIVLSYSGYILCGSSVPWPQLLLSSSTLETLYWLFFAGRLLVLALVVMALSDLIRRNQRAEARISLMVSELRENARTSQALLSALPDAILKVSWDGRILDYICSADNDVFVGGEPVVGRKWVDLLPASYGAEAFKTIQEVIRDGVTRVFSCLLPMTAASSPRFFDLRIVASDHLEVLVLFQDVTPRKEAERLVMERQSQAVSASKMAALGEMAGGIAHEINNPLAIIHGKAQQLKELAESAGPEHGSVETLEIAERIESTSNRISKIIRSLRFFARDGALDPFERFPLNSVLNETLELCRERFVSHRITFRVPQIPEDVWIECRPVQIGQVLLNLLNNAHDAVEGQPAPWVELSYRHLQSTRDEIELSVTDSGPGIPVATRERVFEPFFTTKGISKGTGLGLSISRGIIEDHQGTISVDSECPNTRFTIRLPRSQSL